MNMTYSGVGVDYDAMDPFKRQAQIAGMETASSIRRLSQGKYREFRPSRGESAFLIETPWGFLSHVEEGLGTKNLVADEMCGLTGKSYYDQIAQCTVAMIVNDMITVGALPISVAMHLAVGNSDWFDDQRKCYDLIEGWKKACGLARCVWGGGETPTLKGIVVPGTMVLSGSAVGIVEPKNRLISPDKIRHGDAIVIIESSGIHANGLTMARTIAGKLDDGYLARLPDGRTYGETLLDPTRIYVSIVEECQNQGIDIHYAVNITGHGWRKLMRAPQSLAYVVETLPRKRPIFDFMQQHGPIDDKEAYGNLNMGAGFALYVQDKDARKVIEISLSNEMFAFCAGHIECSTRKIVIIKPKGLEYLGSTLGVR